ncbi:restriction endonuclease subunit S [Mobilicoccus sp.]|uniref:restriction endonuclease subunit S n=1 Tax=Mobilicoccus sp. TaxID=2034349 RepID=UPI0028A8C3D2|nr:restriction endonuclease subunit S [Mobilicoccus sp.]
MNVVALAEVAEIIMGQAPPGDSYNTDGEGLPLIAGAGDFKEGRLAPSRFTTLSTKRSKFGDIVLSIRASIGDAVWSDGEYCLGRGVAALRGRPDVVNRSYLWHWLASAAEALRSKGRGATFLQVNRADIGEMPIPLPPLEEQRRIAAILDQADAIRTKRRQVIAHLEALQISAFESLFADISPLLTIGAASSVQGGLQVSSKRANRPVEVPYMRVANAFRGWLDLTEIKTLRATSDEVRRTTLLHGDLLVVEGHANPREIGRVAMWSNELAAPVVHQNHLIRVRLDPSRVLPQFAMDWLNSSRGAAHFRRAGNTTSGLNTISASVVRSAPLLTVSLIQQRDYVDRVESIRRARQAAMSALGKDDALFASLQARAFRGEL